MRLQHLQETIYSKPWLITPSGHASVQQLFEAKLNDFKADGGEASDFFVQREPAHLDVNGIGHVHIKGVVGLGLSKIEKSCGNTDTKDVTAEIDALVSQGAKGLLLHIDSPGGTVTGVPELADAIVEAAAQVPVFVFSDSQIASAAYWLAASATRIICTESAEIGSIGVYLPWIDLSAKMEREGVASTPVINTGGAYKGIHLFPSLSDAHRAELQAKVDRIFELFSTHVMTMRALAEAVVPNSAMQGQVYLGIDALPQGLVDQVGSKQDAYEALLLEVEFEDEPAPDDAQSDEQVPSDDPSQPLDNSVSS